MTAWRLARSLDKLRSEVNGRWPNRSKASDGTIGDAAHAASASDHNPNPAGVVCAFDITHDPAGPQGADLAELLRARRHPDCKYVIWDRRMFSSYDRPGYPAWTWRPYSGADPHTNHVHVSVGAGPDGRSAPPYDDLDPWLTSQPEDNNMLSDGDLRAIELHAAQGTKEAIANMIGVDPAADFPVVGLKLIDAIASDVVLKLGGR